MVVAAAAAAAVAAATAPAAPAALAPAPEVVAAVSATAPAAPAVVPAVDLLAEVPVLADQCAVCEKTTDPDDVVCDGCDGEYHLHCLVPPVKSVDDLPAGDWYCSKCAGAEAPATAPPGEAGRPEWLVVGARVEAKWRGRSRWFAGNVGKVHLSGGQPGSRVKPGATYDIHYDDGDREQRVKVRAPTRPLLCPKNLSISLNCPPSLCLNASLQLSKIRRPTRATPAVATAADTAPSDHQEGSLPTDSVTQALPAAAQPPAVNEPLEVEPKQATSDASELAGAERASSRRRPDAPKQAAESSGVEGQASTSQPSESQLVEALQKAKVAENRALLLEYRLDAIRELVELLLSACGPPDKANSQALA